MSRETVKSRAHDWLQNDPANVVCGRCGRIAPMAATLSAHRCVQHLEFASAGFFPEDD